MIRPNTFKMVDRCGEEANAENNQNWGYYEAKWPVEIWADGEIQQQLWMDRKQNTWKNIAANLNDNRYKHTASHCKTKMHSHAGNVFETQIKKTCLGETCFLETCQL